MAARVDVRFVARATAKGRGTIAAAKLGGGNTLAIVRRVAEVIRATARTMGHAALHSSDFPDQVINRRGVVWFTAPQ